MTSQPQVEPSHYRGLDYNTKGRWASYWHQISEVLDVSPASCLEVGVGAGYVRHALQENGVTVTTVDIDPRLGVDRVGDVSALSCADGEFDVVLCAQVLEHVPWALVPAALAELARVASKRVVVSLPQSGRPFRWHLQLPVGSAHEYVWRTPGRRPYAFDGQHYWQVGARGTRAADVRNLMRSHFAIEREYVVPENMYHRFYVLSPLP